jgi:glycosyltransferase involved in cell wall biosynthesis
MRDICFINFDGLSGGSNYETNLLSIIRNSAINVSHLQVESLGGWRTIFNVFSTVKLFYSGFYNSDLIRVFGMPVYKKNMIVIFHHYDTTDSPWYSKIVEVLDLFLLKKLSSRFNIKFICVSKFWKSYLESLNLNVFATIYNDIDIDIQGNSRKKFLAKKYNLDFNKQWIFLGANQKKKGGDQIIKGLSSALINKYQFIFTGQEDKNPNVYWFDSQDYYYFLSNCSLVIANSKFLEGWCRVVHESIILDTPVIGSGMGGMNEIFDIIGDRGRNTSECISIIKNGVFDRNSDYREKLSTFIKKENSLSISKLINHISN